jgi:hypothetical protein
MTQTEAEFDRALGAWEDGQLNAHLADEDKADAAYEKAHEIVWDIKLSELYEMAPPGVDRKIEEVADSMVDHVSDLILDGRYS